METENVIAVGLAIIALLISLFAVGSIYYNQPVEVDVSGIDDNRYDINNLLSNMHNMQEDIDDLDLTCNCEIDEDDFEDLEDELENLEEMIEDNEDDIDDLEDDSNSKVITCLKNDNNWTAYRECIGYPVN